MGDYRRSLTGLVILLVVQHTAMVLLFDITQPPVHDETHFVETIGLFADHFNLETLRTYNEMNAPLPFVMYAAWGKVFGFAPASLRAMSLLIALVTYLLVHRLIFTVFECGRTAFWTTAFIAVHPYMMALAILVYTDMPTIGFAVWACLALLKRRPVQLAIALACAMVCRQFAAVYLVAMGAYLLLEWRCARRDDTVRMIVACAVSALPLAALCLLWGGASPDNLLRPRYLAFPVTWQPASFVMYTALLSLYLLPLVAFRWRALVSRPQRWAWAVVFGAMALLFPVRLSQVAKVHKAVTVGFFDTQLHNLFAQPLTRDLIWLVLFIVGMVVLLAIAVHALRQVRTAAIQPGLLFELIVLAFLLVMPLAYMRWEKYFMLVLPAACVSLLHAADKPQPEPVS